MANSNSRTRVGLGAGGGGTVTSSGPRLGPEQNTFGDSTTNNKSAAVTLRNTYQAANADWLAQYNADLDFLILLQWDDGEIVQRRNVAGTSWEDVVGLIVGPAGPGGSLPDGSTIRNRLLWDGSAWSPVSSEGRVYYLITRTNSFDDAKEAILHLLTEGITQYPALVQLGDLEAFSSSINYNEFRESGIAFRQILNVWPQGETSPYIWVLAPNYRNSIQNYTAEYFTPIGTPIAQNDFVTMRNWGRIDGVPYDAAIVQITGDRPIPVDGDPGTAVVNFPFSEPEVAPTVEMGV